MFIVQVHSRVFCCPKQWTTMWTELNLIMSICYKINKDSFYLAHLKKLVAVFLPRAKIYIYSYIQIGPFIHNTFCSIQDKLFLSTIHSQSILSFIQAFKKFRLSQKMHFTVRKIFKHTHTFTCDQRWLFLRSSLLAGEKV